ncbi:hypothetical protein [Micromonospora sp. NPDC004704]
MSLGAATLLFAVAAFAAPSVAAPRDRGTADSRSPKMTQRLLTFLG